MTDLSVAIKLDQIICRDEGDGPGNAEPYLWTVFFKVDGDTVVIESSGPAAPFVSGPPTVVGTPGNHGNLGTNDVDEGDTVAIPAVIGEYRTVMKPIPLTQPLLGITEVDGMIGCLVVLMEEDGTPDSAIVRGHEALDRTVRDRLAGLLSTLSITKPAPTDADIAELSGMIGDAVKSAITDGVSVFDWIGAFGNMDDQIGSAVFLFSHKQLATGGTIPFGRRWDNEGDWEIRGSITSTVLRRPKDECCADLTKQVSILERRLAALEAKAAGIKSERPALSKDSKAAIAKVRNSVPSRESVKV